MPVSDEDGFEDTKLHEAVRYGDITEVREALSEGHDPNQIGTYQWSALHEASNNGDVDIVQLLIKHGGQANQPDCLRGCTAVHYAASQGHEEVLRLLITVGGQWNVENMDGQNCLQVAVGECRNLLQRQRDQSNHLHTPSKETLIKNVLEDTRQIILCEKPASVGKDINDNDSERDSILFDDISIATSDSIDSGASRPAAGWPTGKKELVLGSATLSFEYNSKKAMFKVRVWQISELLLPPAETSMIHSVYVKTYLQPDKHTTSKRKTEEVKVIQDIMPTNKPQSNSSDTGHNVIFKPSTFKFTKALEYTSVTANVAQSSTVELVVCVVQKYTRKSFPIATWNMPLKLATRKLLKEKYPLKPCISLNIPENMKVYHGGQIQVVHSGLSHSESNPSLAARRPSTSSWAVPYSERAASDSNLHAIKVERQPSSAASIEISVPEEEEDKELNEALQQIAIMERKERAEMEGITLPGFAPGDDDEDDHELGGVQVHSPREHIAEVQVHMPADASRDMGKESGDYNRRKVRKKSLGASIKEKMRSGHNKPAKKPDIVSVSCLDSPEWDGDTEPITMDMVPMEFEDDLAFPSSDKYKSQLARTVSLEMPEIHRGFKRHESEIGASARDVESSFTSSTKSKQENLQVRYETDAHSTPNDHMAAKSMLKAIEYSRDSVIKPKIKSHNARDTGSNEGKSGKSLPKLQHEIIELESKNTDILSVKTDDREWEYSV